MSQDDQAKLTKLRQQIRDVDDRLLSLAAERLALAKAIGVVKAAANLPVKDYRVEKDVIERGRAKARDLGLYESLAEDLFRLLISYSVAAQDEHQAMTKRQKSQGPLKVLIAGGQGRMGRWLSHYFDSFGYAVTHYDPGASGKSSSFPLVTNLAKAAAEQDVIVLSTPISVTAAVIGELAKAKTKALVFDICSLKTPLLGAIKDAAREGLRISSVHPMFGPEVDLLAGRNILICDTGDAALTAETKALFEGTTAELVVLPLERHDQLMSYVLGLSHLTSLVFASALEGSGIAYDELRRAASTTFNAQLEVSAPVVKENQDLYYEIQAENRFTPELVQAVIKRLEQYGEVLQAKDRGKFKELMERGRVYLGQNLDR